MISEILKKVHMKPNLSEIFNPKLLQILDFAGLLVSCGESNSKIDIATRLNKTPKIDSEDIKLKTTNVSQKNGRRDRFKVAARSTCRHRCR